ncbi:hypothetical protein TPHA_0A01150 [Tetrapisispora phaffii CBS 4417]|uniref:Uncharacterized protein n=1 Tax=Tetrapisispora phaffii (strain ATCC 24235 / CBS 4417 / NBRC 1672 / NRRL Y-8282 / UCD 70-5) TaxID=1071381 RepID=G8BMS1_TETPH|nr:hypothetical protein TPHA_0A01150 [Tetrapisispora phaffii CBS 4417]CCE61199.1 hypothetical protein TPHA_0A01150 [Tetrapisispora phaffii CBS 4417]
MDSSPKTPRNKVGPIDFIDMRQGELGLKDSSGDYKVQPVGKSSPSRMNGMQNQSFANSDLALDCILRTNQPSDNNNMEKEILDNIDINQMFNHKADKIKSFAKDSYQAIHKELNDDDDDDDDDVVRMNHSPIKIDISSPVKASDEAATNTHDTDVDGPIVKRPKLQLDGAPDLQKDYGEREDSYNEGNTLPKQIDMVDMIDSPNKFSLHVDNMKTIEIQKAIFETTNEETHRFDDMKADKKNTESNSDKVITPEKQTRDDTPNLNKLTPLYNTDLAISMQLNHLEENKKKYVIDEHNSFKVISERNKDLIAQINNLNKELNISLSAQEQTIYNFKLLKAEYDGLSEKYETKINITAEEMENIQTERENQNRKIDKLKKKISEYKDEISMLNQNQKILQNKYNQTSDESEKWKLSHEEVNDKLQALEKDHQAVLNNLNQLISDKEKLGSELSSYENQVKDLNENIHSLEEKDKLNSNKLETITEEYKTLQQKLQDTLSQQSGTTNDLNKQLEETRLAKIEVESQLDELKTSSISEKETLEIKLKETEQQLENNTKLVDELLAKKTSLETELHEKINSIELLKKQNTESNDDSEINKAQVGQLKIEIQALKEKEMVLNDSINKLEDKTEEWKMKYQDKCSDLDKNRLEVESLQMKCKNMEEEHLAELERVHANISLLQTLIEENNDNMNTLKKENELLKTGNSKTNRQEETMNENMTKMSDEINSLKTETTTLKEQLANKEQEINKRLKLLAEDLYVQYSSKHEQKVKLLKKGYDSKYQTKIDQLTLQNEGYLQEVDQLKKQLALERNEKQKVLQLLEKE